MKTNTTPIQETDDKGFTIDELFDEVDRCTKDGTNPELPKPFEIKPLDLWSIKNREKLRGEVLAQEEIDEMIEYKINQIISYLKTK